MKDREKERAPAEKSDAGSAARVRPQTKKPTGPSKNPVLKLQQTIGNQGVMNLLQSGAIQPKLRVSQPGDADELEADRIADQVVSSSAPATLHRKCSCEGGATCPACEEERVGQAKGIHRKGSPSSSGDESVRDDFLQSLGPGQPLEPPVRQSMESEFGRDFKDVRVHADSQAADSARSINARAFTSGSDVVFASHEYAPHTPAGKKLLAHELAHVVQQGATHQQVVQRQPAPSPQTGPAASQTAPTPARLTQALYDQAIALLTKLPTANATLVRILQQGKVGQRVHRLQVTTSATQTPRSPSTTPDAGSPPASPAVTFVFDLEISPSTGQLPQGAFADFVDDPASQTSFTGTATSGQTITRLLKIVTKAPAGANAPSDLASALMHEGTHMLVAIDSLLQSMAQDPGIAAGLSGSLKAFDQYRQAGNRSALRASLVAGMVSEINRVMSPPSAAPSPATSGPSAGPSASSAPATPPPASGGPSPAQIAAQVIDLILGERFAIDQQRTQLPQSPPVSNTTVAQAYLFDYLASEAGRKPWPASPNARNLIGLLAAFLDDVMSLLAPPAAKSTGPSPSPTTAAPPKTP